MGADSKIEWTDATWNPIVGCSVVSPGCTNCYAMRLAGTRLKNHLSRKGLTTGTKAGPVWNGKVRFSEKTLPWPLSWRGSKHPVMGPGKPSLAFVCAHGDLFHEAVPDEWIDLVFAVMALSPQHTFQVLTKRPERMRDYLNDTDAQPRWVLCYEPEWFPADLSRVPETFPSTPLPNVWLGVSAEDQAWADERIPLLLDTPAAKRFVSCEPLLGPVDLKRFFRQPASGAYLPAVRGLRIHGQGLDWVIVGGESGPGARPMHPDWARGLRDQCQAAGVPLFFKQWGSHLPGDMSGEDERGRPAYLIEEEHCGVDYDVLGRGTHVRAHGYDFIRFSHKNTGAMLDGREWREFPA